MTNIAGRLKKSEDLLRELAPSEKDIPRFFIRMGENLDIPGEDEKEFLKKNPDYNGQIYHVLIGRQPGGDGQHAADCPKEAISGTGWDT
jgi:hypothetical protein